MTATPSTSKSAAVRPPLTGSSPPALLYTRIVGFEQFLGNSDTVSRLRQSMRTGRFPQAMILAGPKGAGKYALALMLARAVNCLEPTVSDGLPDFCGHCHNCQRIG